MPTRIKRTQTWFLLDSQLMILLNHLLWSKNQKNWDLKTHHTIKQHHLTQLNQRCLEKFHLTNKTYSRLKLSKKTLNQLAETCEWTTWKPKPQSLQILPLRMINMVFNLQTQTQLTTTLPNSTKRQWTQCVQIASNNLLQLLNWNTEIVNLTTRSDLTLLSHRRWMRFSMIHSELNKMMVLMYLHNMRTFNLQMILRKSTRDTSTKLQSRTQTGAINTLLKLA